jgi:hypothetical protein
MDLIHGIPPVPPPPPFKSVVARQPPASASVTADNLKPLAPSIQRPELSSAKIDDLPRKSAPLFNPRGPPLDRTGSRYASPPVLENFGRFGDQPIGQRESRAPPLM